MDKAEAAKVASEIAESIGEVGDRPRAQIARIVMLMGEEWARSMVQEAAAWEEREVGPVWRKDGTERTTGGVFFATARERARDCLQRGEIKRRDFFRCFFDKAPEPKEPKTRLAPPPRKARTPRPDPAAAARRVRERRAAPEVYTVVRRAAR